MYIKDTTTGNLLNIDNYEQMTVFDNLPYQTKIIMDVMSGGWYETTVTITDITNGMKEKRSFILGRWQQKWRD